MVEYIRRNIDEQLLAWKENPMRKPLLIRGARQVGKSSAIKHLGSCFTYFVEVNFERNKAVKEFFQGDIDVHLICQKIANYINVPVEEGKTLLMFPEGTTSDGTGLLKLHANLFDAAAKTGAEVIPVVLRYKSRGEITTAPAYVGKVGLFECLWKVVNTPDLTILIKIGEPIRPMAGEDRHSLCRRASAVMSAAIGVADPLAVKAEAVLQPEAVKAPLKEPAL